MSAPRFPVILSPAAREDYQDILLYTLLRWGERQQVTYEAALDHALTALGDNPTLGRARNDLRPGCRSYAVEHHVIFYEVGERAILVLRILHGRMDARPAVQGGS